MTPSRFQLVDTFGSMCPPVLAAIQRAIWLLIRGPLSQGAHPEGLFGAQSQLELLYNHIDVSWEPLSES